MACPGVPRIACGGGEQDERVEVVVGGEVVQMPGGVGFGGQHGVELLAGQFGDHGVIEDARGVDDGGQRVGGGDGCQYRGQLGGVAGVAGGDGDLGAQAVSRCAVRRRRERRARCERPAADAGRRSG